MSHWKCSIAPSCIGDARASLGGLAEEVFQVEASSKEEALEKAKAAIMGRSPLTSTLPVDLLDDWLVAEPDDGR